MLSKHRSNINSFAPNAPFLYSLKTSENRKVFLCFQGIQKEWIGNKWVNKIEVIQTSFINPMMTLKQDLEIILSGKIAPKQLHWNHTSAWVISCKSAAYFLTPSPKNTSGRLLLERFTFHWLEQHHRIKKF